eukprot:Rmarinus@m.21162
MTSTEVTTFSIDSILISSIAAEKPPMTEVSYDVSVAIALDAMDRSKISTIPVWAPVGKVSSEGAFVVQAHGKQYLGIVSLVDIATYLLENKGREKTALASPIWEAVGRSAEGLSMVLSPSNSPVRSVMQLLANGVTHRVLVPLKEGDGETFDYRIISQTDIMYFLLKNLAMIEGVARFSLEHLNLVNRSRPVISISEGTPVRDALKEMRVAGVRSIAVVAPTGSLTTCFTVDDLRGLGQSDTKDLDLSVVEYKALHPTGEAPVTCAPDWSLAGTLAHMAVNNSHRVWVVDPELKPVGVVSQTDIINTVLKSM